MQRVSAPPDVGEIVEGDDDHKGQEEGWGRKRDNQEGKGAGRPPTTPARSSRVPTLPRSSQESATAPEEGMPPTCSDFPAHAFFSVDDVWCDACGQACSLAQVRVKSKANGTWQCKSCDLTYSQVHRLNGDPTTATADFYADAAGKWMAETKKL